MAWTTLQYSRERANAAARALVAWYAVEYYDYELYRDYDAGLPVINNWRSSHGFPLNTFRVGLNRAARRFDPECLVAQRIKRLSSITAKLERFPQMKLSQMQDIGGCRAVMRSVEMVYELVGAYKQSQIKHRLVHVDDYIEQPPESGYRGVHLVYRYFSDKRKDYNDLKIEMQLRSTYQHAWATAVETVGTFVQQALKSSVGPAPVSAPANKCLLLALKRTLAFVAPESAFDPGHCFVAAQREFVRPITLICLRPNKSQCEGAPRPPRRCRPCPGGLKWVA